MIPYFSHIKIHWLLSTINTMISPGVCRTGSKRTLRQRKPSTTSTTSELSAMGAMSGLKRSPSTLSTTSTASGYRPRSSPAGLYSYTGGTCRSLGLLASLSHLTSDLSYPFSIIWYPKKDNIVSQVKNVQVWYLYKVFLHVAATAVVVYQ